MAEPRVTTETHSEYGEALDSTSLESIRRLQRGPLLPLIVLFAATLIYLSIFRHSDSIPTAVGANLVPAERVLKGEVPYRDFYKIQTPGILFLNAFVFRLFGTSLLAAMSLVLIFKVATVTIVFLCARSVSDWKLALVSAFLSLVWVAPGGPFRSAPVQFEATFVVIAIWFTLRWLREGKAWQLFSAGLAVGMIAVFKQNVGVYSAIALELAIVLKSHELPRTLRAATKLIIDSFTKDGKAHLASLLGMAVPIAALTLYLLLNHALGAALRVFVRGPGEHLQSRFTGYPLPKFALPIIAAFALGLMVARWIAARYPQRREFINALLLIVAATSALLIPRSALDNTLYWFAPSLFGFALWRYIRSRNDSTGALSGYEIDRGVLLILLLFSLAAYGEVFPRSVRGLVIDTMPPAFILLAFLCRIVNVRKSETDATQVEPRSSYRKVAFAAAALVMVIFALRVVLPGYLEFGRGRGLHVRPNVELTFDRGRSIYLPPKRAAEVNSTVDFITNKVEPGGYIFAHALDATNYYLLADRNSPTTATLWNDTGTDNAERARIVDALKEKQVRLVLTSKKALAAERYKPLLELLSLDFHQAGSTGQTIFLERNF